MVNKIIADFLKTSKRLVVPQFGAFIRKEDSGTIAFVPFLKKDDGVLNQLLCTAYGLTPNDAQTVINEFVEEVKESVSTRGVYIIEGVGSITADPNGILRMESGTPSQPTVQQSTVIPEDPKPTQQAAAPKVATEVQTPPVTPFASPVNKGTTERPVPPAQTSEPRTSPPVTPTPRPSVAAQATPSPAPRTDYTQQPSSQQKNSGAPIPTPQKPYTTFQQSKGNTAQPSGQPASNRPFEPSSRPAPQQPPVRPPYGRTPQGPRRPAKKNKADLFIIIAIIAATIALGVMIFGFLVGRSGPDLDSLISPAVQVDSTATDSTTLQVE